MDFKAALSQLRKLFVLLDYDGQGTLDFNEARPFLQFLVRKYISSTLSTDEQHLELMFDAALGTDVSDDVNIAEFIWFVFQIRASVLALENDLPEALSPSPTGSKRNLGSFVLEDAEDEKTEEAAARRARSAHVPALRVHPAS